jgi:hypothetical protein
MQQPAPVADRGVAGAEVGDEAVDGAHTVADRC